MPSAGRKDAGNETIFWRKLELACAGTWVDFLILCYTAQLGRIASADCGNLIRRSTQKVFLIFPLEVIAAERRAHTGSMKIHGPPPPSFMRGVKAG